MRRPLPVLLGVALWSTAAGAAVPRASITYDIEATVDPRRQVIDATARITIPSQALASPREVLLDVGAGGRDVRGVPRLTLLAVRGGLLAPARGDGSLARVTIPASLADPAHVEVSWRFKLDSDDRALMGYHCLPADEPGSLWYPAVAGAPARPGGFSDFRVTITYPSTMAVLTSGILKSGAGSRQSRRDTYVAEHAEGFALNLGEGYLLTEVKRPGTRVIAFSPGAERAVFRQAAEVAATTIDWYRKTYGFFPAAQIGIAPGHPKWKGGFPTTNLFYIHGGDRSPAFLKTIIAHELGHYYWGLHVRSASWERLDWLMLGNGIWADQLFQSQSAGRTLEDQWRGNEWMVKLLAAQLAGREQRLGISAEEEKALGFDYNSAVRHAKGAVGVWLQSRRLGTERFLALQKRLLAEYRDRPLPVEELGRRLEAAGAAGARAFFRALARADATFGFEVSKVERKRADAGWSYQLTVARRGTLRYPIAVEVRDQRGKAVRRALAGDAPQETLAVVLEAPLAEVRLDPDGILPMWNGSHTGIRTAYVRALDRAGLTEAFIVMATDLLRATPGNDEIRIRLAERLLQAGRCRAAEDLLSGQARLTCRGTSACRLAPILSTVRTLCGRGEPGR